MIIYLHLPTHNMCNEPPVMTSQLKVNRYLCQQLKNEIFRGSSLVFHVYAQSGVDHASKFIAFWRNRIWNGCNSPWGSRYHTEISCWEVLKIIQFHSYAEVTEAQIFVINIVFSSECRQLPLIPP